MSSTCLWAGYYDARWYRIVGMGNRLVVERRAYTAMSEPTWERATKWESGEVQRLALYQMSALTKAGAAADVKETAEHQLPRPEVRP